MAGTSQKQTSRRTTAGTGQRNTTQKKTTQKKTAQSSKTKQSTGSRGGSRSSGSRKSTPSGVESFVGKEIGILALFAVCVLLFLSNLGLCGAVGAALHKFQSGVFGFFGYLFPVYLFAAVLFYISNQENSRMVAKVAVSACLFLVLCGIAALLTTKDFDKTITIAQYYERSTAQAGGGVVGGLVLKLLCPTIGTLGAYIVSILLLVIGLVFITERSVLQPISRGSRKVYDTAREDMARRREIHAEKTEERRRYRLEQKVSGVALEPLANEYPGSVRTAGEEAEPAAGDEPVVVEEEWTEQESTVSRADDRDQRQDNEEVKPSGLVRGDTAVKQKPPVKTAAVVEPPVTERRPIRITGIGFEKEESSLKEEPQREDVFQPGEEGLQRADALQKPEPARTIASLSREGTDSPMIPSSEDILVLPKDTRTLAELEALDSLHSNVFSTVRRQAVWNEPKEDSIAGETVSSFMEEKEPVLEVPSGILSIQPEQSRTSDQPEISRTVLDQPEISRAALDQPEISRAVLDQPEFSRAVLDQPEISPAILNQSEIFPATLDQPEFSPIALDQSELSFAGLSQPEPSPAVLSQPEDEADVKRVVTANGKIMEVDIDPDDDPLTRKLVEKRLAEREAAGTKDRGVSQDVTTKLAGAEGNGYYGNLYPDPAVSGKENRRFAGKPAQAGLADTRGGGIQPPEDLQEWVAMTTKPAEPVKKAPPKPYVRPPYNLMKSGGKERKNSDRELRETARKLENTLQNFGVGVTVTNISCGPSVTRYELQPEQGVRVSKIVGLSDDIKLNLAAADIRIEAPIPGKASVGIEVPNKENTTVFLRDVLESTEFTSHSSKLAFAVGRDISGEVVVTDLAKMPHLLIAGATGSGKSVCINTLIMSVLYKAKPEEVRLIMVDPKVVELSIYNGIPHLMIPVVTDPKKAAGALNWAVAEMTDRYRKFADWNVRDLKGYNEKIKAEAEKNGETAETLPQIVIIIDELADLMMVCPGDVEDAICRLAQMARAAGLHLVIATQRPSVNVITGLIKANVPSRIAFSVSSGVDSRTIIDMNGAEKLLGKGDMLFYPSGYQKPVRVQGAFVSDSEVSAVVDFLKENNEGQTFDSAVEARLASMNTEEGKGAGGGHGPERDEYFAEAGRFIIEKQKASIGMLQRAFKVGFNRAARIMDQLAEAGVVSEEAGTKAREILMDMEQYRQLLEELGLA